MRINSHRTPLCLIAIAIVSSHFGLAEEVNASTESSSANVDNEEWRRDLHEDDNGHHKSPITPSYGYKGYKNMYGYGGYGNYGYNYGNYYPKYYKKDYDKHYKYDDNWNYYNGWKHGWNYGWDDNWKTMSPTSAPVDTCPFIEETGEDNFFFNITVQLLVDCQSSHFDIVDVEKAYLEFYNADLNCVCPGNDVKYTEVVFFSYSDDCDASNRRDLRENRRYRKLQFFPNDSGHGSRGECGNFGCPTNPLPGGSGFGRHLGSKSGKKGKKAPEKEPPACGESLLIKIFKKYGIVVETIVDFDFEKVPACESAFVCDVAECCHDLPFNACPTKTDACHCGTSEYNYGETTCMSTSCFERLDLSADPPAVYDWH